jgi:hypothetical protein
LGHLFWLDPALVKSRLQILDAICLFVTVIEHIHDGGLVTDLTAF